MDIYGSITRFLEKFMLRISQIKENDIEVTVSDFKSYKRGNRPDLCGNIEIRRTIKDESFIFVLESHCCVNIKQSISAIPKDIPEILACSQCNNYQLLLIIHLNYIFEIGELELSKIIRDKLIVPVNQKPF